MVSKTSASGVKKAAAPTQKKKTASKTSTQKVSTKKVETKVLNTQVPVKENVNPLEKVMEIKAKNDEKKTAKAAAKSSKMVKSATVAEEKGAKITVSNVSKTVKETAQKAAAKKFNETKEENVSAKTPCCCCFCKNEMLAAWARTYKNIFNFKGRTSRFEFWGFSLLNIFFVLALVGGIVAWMGTPNIGAVMATVLLGTLFCFVIVELLVYLSLMVRRLHDTGNTAWKGFFRPLVFCWGLAILVLIGCVFIVGQYGSTLLSDNVSIQFSIAAYALLMLIVFLTCFYYSAKLLIVASFFEEENSNNAYGAVCYHDACYKTKALKYAALYYTLMAFFNLIAETFSKYVQYNQF